MPLLWAPVVCILLTSHHCVHTCHPPHITVCTRATHLTALCAHVPPTSRHCVPSLLASPPPAPPQVRGSALGSLIARCPYLALAGRTTLSTKLEDCAQLLGLPQEEVAAMATKSPRFLQKDYRSDQGGLMWVGCRCRRGCNPFVCAPQ